MHVIFCAIGVLLLALSGCTTTHVGNLPAKLHSVPGTEGPLDRWLAKTRDRFERDDAGFALRAVEDRLDTRPQHVNSHRLRQDILRRRGRLGLVLAESEARLAKHPDAAWAHYLHGRTASTNAARTAAFRRAVELDASSFWGWYGLAFTLRQTDNERANELYGYLYARSEHDVRTGVAYAQSLRAGGRYGDAARIYNELRKKDRGIGAVGMAETLIRSGKRKQAWPFLLEGLRFRGHDPLVRVLVANSLARGLPDDGVQELLDVLREAPGRLAEFGRRAPGLLADLFQRVGEPESALRVLRSAMWLPARDRHTLRRLLITCDGVPAFLRDVRDGFLPEILADEGNQVRSRWRSLLTGPWMNVDDPLAEAEPARVLLRALVDVGMLGHADLVASKALLRHPEDELLAATQQEVRRELAFENGLRRMLTRGYVAFGASGTEGSLEKTFDRIRDLSKRTLGRDVVGEPELFDLPFVGVLVDSLGPGLPAHLAKYNKHLVMGKRNARPTEGMILTRLSLRHVDAVPEVPLPARTVEVVGEHRELEPFEQADLAGIALLNHYVIDMDEVRAWANTIAARRRIIATDDGALLRDPIPQEVPRAAPAGVEWRLSALSPVEDSGLEAAVLDIIRWHERGHMVDFLHLLPIEWHPLRAIALTVRNGFSALGVASEMEARAELAALAMSPHTRLVAAHIAGFLSGEGGASPHAHGFRDLVEDILDELDERKIEGFEVRNWHRVDPHILREVAQQLLRTLW